MDTLEAANKVLSRIQSFDPQNASKIMGFILIQEHGDKDIIRLAHGPDALLLSLISEAKAFLGLSSNGSSSASTPTPSPTSPSLGPFSRPSLRVTIPQNGFLSSPWSNGSPAYSRSPVLGLPGSSGPFSFSSGEPIGRLPLLDESCDSLGFPSEGTRLTQHLQNQMCSPREVFTSDSNDGGWRHRMYDNSKFLHGAAAASVDFPTKEDTSFDELLRLKALHQQQRLSAASMLMASGGHFPFTYNNCMSNLNENPRLEPVVCDLSGVNSDGYSNPCSCQIYLTFPADSTFSEEDVSNHFSMYGPVQDVRIPYQQKRMFGFVTFVYPETVKLILAKGNPHFVCDSRVLVKPYKEMGKVSDKNRKQKQLYMDIGKVSTCLSPSGLDSREPFDIPFGPRMFHKSKEATLRRMLEQEAHLHKAIELHSRRLMNLQLMDQKNKENSNELQQPSSSPIIPVPQSPNHQSLTHKVTAESNGSQAASVCQDDNSGSEKSGNKQHNDSGSSELPKRSLEDTIPGKFAAFHENSGIDDCFSPTPLSNNTPTLPSLQSCCMKIPRLSDQEAIEV